MCLKYQWLLFILLNIYPSHHQGDMALLGQVFVVMSNA